MPFQKGNKLSRGRGKGTPNKRTLMVNEVMQRVKVDPLEILAMFAAGDWKGLGYGNEMYFVEKPDGAVKMGYVIPPELRLSAAKEAAQYVYPKKKEEIKTEEEPFEVSSIEDRKKLLEEAKKEIKKLEDEISNITEDSQPEEV